MPLKAGLANIGTNIKEMEASGHPRKQAVAASLHKAYNKKAHGGPISGATAGRADQVPLDVPEGSYVIPADVVAACGDGNTEAGMRVLSQLFPAKLATGGKTVPIAASDGEFVVTPENVQRAGGDAALRHFVVSTRKMYAQKLANLPGPRK